VRASPVIRDGGQRCSPCGVRGIPELRCPVVEIRFEQVAVYRQRERCRAVPEDRLDGLRCRARLDRSCRCRVPQDMQAGMGEPQAGEPGRPDPTGERPVAQLPPEHRGQMPVGCSSRWCSPAPRVRGSQEGNKRVRSQEPDTGTLL
jgi:hypothetical protein